LVHLDRRGPDLTVYGLQALETDAWWWFFCSSWYPPVRWVNSGPVRAQQMFEYYELPTRAPTWESASAPRFLQAAYLKARQRGDQAGAESYLEQLRHAFPGQHSTMLTPEIELLGYVFHPDVQGFEVYFHVRGPVPGAKWVYFLHTNRSSDGAFRDLGGAVLDWTAGSVVRAERFVWESGEAALRIGLWRAPDEFAPPKSGKDAGVLMGPIDLGTQFKF
jgi:hypothetical protein